MQGSPKAKFNRVKDVVTKRLALCHLLIMYSLKDYQYELPIELIAQMPVRDGYESRLLILNRTRGTIEHKRITALEDHLAAGDVVVVNDTTGPTAGEEGIWRSGRTSGAESGNGQRTLPLPDQVQ